MKTRLCILTTLAVLLLAAFATADVPQMINYQGRLTDGAGAPLDTTVSMAFAIYDDSTGGVTKWDEVHPLVSVEEGSFNVILGSVVPIDDTVFNEPGRWLGITVGGDPELSPRIYLVSVGCAFRVGTVDGATGGTVSGDFHATGTIISGNSIAIDGVNDRITSTSGSIDFDNENLSTTGSIDVAGFSMSTGAATDYVLTSDASGVGTWQEAAGTGEWTKSGNAIYTNEKIGIARNGATLHGMHDSTHVNIGVSGTTGAGGMDYKYATVSGGYGGNAGQDNATVGGGRLNKAYGQSSTVAGGASNTANEDWSTIAGGTYNYADGQWSFVGAGTNDSAKGGYSVVTGGNRNLASGTYSIISGGSNNTASGGSSVISGGADNLAAATHAVIPGGYADTIAVGADYSYLFGIASKLTQDSTFMVDMPHIRFGNEANGYEFPTADGTEDQVMATDGSGHLSWTDVSSATSNWTVIDSVLYTNAEWGIARAGNTLYGNAIHSHVNLGRSSSTGDSVQNRWSCTVGGGGYNEAIGDNSTVGGGVYNYATGPGCTVSGGDGNYASKDHSTISGGMFNKADNHYSSVGGGHHNWATGPGSTIAGGEHNGASNEHSSIGGGYYNSVGGKYSTIPGGRDCGASGDYSFSAGRRAKAIHDGAFVWADTTDADFESTADNQMSIRAENGVRIAVDAGEGKSTDVGERYRDNSIIAWGGIWGDGNIAGSYGVSDVTRNSAGNYTVTLTASSASVLCMVVSPEIDSHPTSASAARLVSVNSVNSTTYDVYITDGNFAAVDNDFQFVITAR